MNTGETRQLRRKSRLQIGLLQIENSGTGVSNSRLDEGVYAEGMGIVKAGFPYHRAVWIYPMQGWKEICF